MKTKDSQSQLQKNFQTQSTFKRNTRYFDAPQIMNIQNQYSIRRRKPIDMNQNADDKIHASFTNSTAILSDKLEKDIGKYKHRVSLSGDINFQESVSPRSSQSPKSPRVKSFFIGKMLSRGYIDARTNKPEQDQRLFNNFKIEKHDLSKTCDIGKLKERKLDFTLKQINDIYHEDHQKIYQDFYYKRSTTHCKFNHKLQNRDKKRYFFNKRRPQNDPSTVLNPEKVDKGLKIASNFKGSNLRNDGLDPFYKGSGKDLPSQYDNRFMNELSNHYKTSSGRIQPPKLDFMVSKLKDDMESERKRKLKQTKRPSFSRNQICDERYFKMNIA